jgi:hypothetical protein
MATIDKIVELIRDGKFKKGKKLIENNRIKLEIVPGIEDAIHEGIGKLIASRKFKKALDGFLLADEHNMYLATDKIARFLPQSDEELDKIEKKLDKFGFKFQLIKCEGLKDLSAFKDLINKVEEKKGSKEEGIVNILSKGFVHYVPIQNLTDVKEKLDRTEIGRYEFPLVSHAIRSIGDVHSEWLSYLNHRGKLLMVCISSDQRRVVKPVLEELGKKQDNRKKLPNGEDAIQSDKIALAVRLWGKPNKINHQKALEYRQQIEDSIFRKRELKKHG